MRGHRAARVASGAAPVGLGLSDLTSGTSSAQPAVDRGKPSFCASFVRGVPSFGSPVHVDDDGVATTLTFPYKPTSPTQ